MLFRLSGVERRVLVLWDDEHCTVFWTWWDFWGPNDVGECVLLIGLFLVVSAAMSG